jgi:hypothetical protein
MRLLVGVCPVLGYKMDLFLCHACNCGKQFFGFRPLSLVAHVVGGLHTRFWIRTQSPQEMPFTRFSGLAISFC